MFSRGVLDAQRLVVEHVRVQRQARRLVGQQLLGQRCAERHDHAAFDLLLERERVDAPARRRARPRSWSTLIAPVMVSTSTSAACDGQGHALPMSGPGCRSPGPGSARQRTGRRRLSATFLDGSLLTKTMPVLHVHVVGFEVNRLVGLLGVVDELLGAPVEDLPARVLARLVHAPAARVGLAGCRSVPTVSVVRSVSTYG